MFFLTVNIGATSRAVRSDLTGVDHDHRPRRPTRGYSKTQREDFQLATTEDYDMARDTNRDMFPDSACTR